MELIEIVKESVRVDLQYVGSYADIKPVPKSGKILLSDIGNLTLREHTGAKNVDLTDDLCQQMIGEQNKKPIDPQDFRGAIWRGGKKVDFTDYAPPPPPDTWFCAYLNDVAGSGSSAAWDTSENALKLVADVRDGNSQANWGVLNETAAIYYVGRLPAGTNLRAQVAIKSSNQDRYGTPAIARVRGWADGWFGGDQDYHTYHQFTAAPGSGWVEMETTFTVLRGWEDIWVTCEVLSNDPRYAKGDMNVGHYRDFSISA
jgi:hypothetical protein